MGGFKHYVADGGSGPIPPTANTVGTRPANPSYVELAATPVQWATAVAENLTWLAAQPYSIHTISECWIDDEAAVCLRYHNAAGAYALRTEPKISPISGPLSPTRLDRASGTAIKQASNILDVTLGPGPAEPVWTDPGGTGWWGTPPAAGWPTVAEPGRRRATIPVH